MYSIAKIVLKLTVNILLLATISLALSCSERCEGNEYKFRIRIEVTMPLEEELKVSYITKQNPKEWRFFIVPITGNSNRQFVEFCFPEEPIDFKYCFEGINKELSTHSMLLENTQKQKFIKGENLNLYFAPNIFLEFNKTEIGYKVKNESQANYKPCLYAREPLKKLLKKRLKENNAF